MTTVDLVVVVRDGTGVRHERLSVGPDDSVLVGRGWHCDLIVQDPQVDAEHAKLSISERGQLQCADAESRNGLRIAGTTAGPAPLSFTSGGVLEMGRSTVAVFRTDHDVPPAVEPSRWDSIRVLLERPVWAIGSLLLLLVCDTLELFGTTTQPLTADAFVGAMSFSLLGCGTWVFFWGVLSKLLRNSAHLTAHLSIAASAGVAVFLLGQLSGYMGWQTLNVGIESFVAVVGAAVLLFFVGALTLGVATRLRRRGLLVLACIPGVLLLASTYVLPMFRDDEAQWYPELITSSYPPGWQLTKGTSLPDFLQEAPRLFEASADDAAERAAELEAEKRSD